LEISVITKTPELLAPAGTMKSLRYAFAYGADAVYAGQPRYSLRARNNEFTLDNIKTGIEHAHALGKKFFLASNVLPHDNKIKTYLKDIAPVIELGPDALIMADPGLMMMVRERWPELAIHLSVQANTLNSAAVRFWHSVGVRRVILSRELSLTEIASIRQQCPEMELEVFVHGAICIAYSGRCLLSGYFNHRDPNQGVCTNACRWEYKTHEAKENEASDVVLIEEASREGELMPVYEDEHGTYIMNSKDLRAIEHIQQLVEIGVDSLKIEGRTKSFYYVARTCLAYRKAIDDAAAGKPFDPQLMFELDGLANRGYTDGFLQRHKPQDMQNYEQGSSQYISQRFVGEVIGTMDGKLEIDVKNNFKVGQTVELLLPDGNHRFVLERIENKEGGSMSEAPGSGYQLRIPAPAGIRAEFGLLVVDL
jgi:putative protease